MKISKLTQMAKANPKKAIIISVIVLIVIWYAYKKYQENKFSTVKYDPNNIPVDNLGNKWNPEPLAREIYENLEGWNVYVYPETSKKVLDLNNDQTKFLYNYYNRYLAEEHPTLTMLFDKEWNGNSGWTGGNYDAVVSKLKALGLD